LLLLVCSIPANAQTRVQRPAMAPKARTDALLRTVMLSTHNAARAELGERPLIWDNRLAQSAADYAAMLERSGRFEHSRQRDAATAQGENLWMGTRDAYSFEEMVDGWIDERRHYRPAPVPASSNTGRWSDVAHYTQIVWQSATAMGCAMASNRADDFLVCRYSPAGNVIGELAYR
jgi:hypothetical protein